MTFLGPEDFEDVMLGPDDFGFALQVLSPGNQYPRDIETPLQRILCGMIDDNMRREDFIYFCQLPFFPVCDYTLDALAQFHASLGR